MSDEFMWFMFLNLQKTLRVTEKLSILKIVFKFLKEILEVKIKMLDFCTKFT